MDETLVEGLRMGMGSEKNYPQSFPLAGSILFLEMKGWGSFKENLPLETNLQHDMTSISAYYNVLPTEFLGFWGAFFTQFLSRCYILYMQNSSRYRK
jgi:hypothetical protein